MNCVSKNTSTARGNAGKAQRAKPAAPRSENTRGHASLAKPADSCNPVEYAVQATTRTRPERPPDVTQLKHYERLAEFHLVWQDRQNGLEKYAKSIPEPVREPVAQRHNMLFRAIDHFQVPLEDMSFSKDTMELQWPGKMLHVRELLKQGAMKRLENMELLEHPSKRRKIQISDYGRLDPECNSLQRVDSKDANNSTETMDPTLANDIRQLLRKMKVKSNVWDGLESHVRSPSPSLGEARRYLQNISNRLVYRMNKVFTAQNRRNFPGKFEDVIRLMLLATGVLRMHEVDWVRYKENWENLIVRFAEAEPKAWVALDAIQHNEELNEEYIGPMLAPAIMELKNSPSITKQQALYWKLRALLYGQLEVQGHWVDG
ncbi:uncharacterized protein FTOL_02219 [Fusarium torulosum]|uniref:Uncharacterized protein n=1 Tax=Fusarium torulosum TaxID=33205 RepID=A0AAE8M1J3_9HYPO|nr:uncharacterized protein FTOL_02219 [Fusarium torulosum]